MFVFFFMYDSNFLLEHQHVFIYDLKDEMTILYSFKNTSLSLPTLRAPHKSNHSTILGESSDFL